MKREASIELNVAIADGPGQAILWIHGYTMSGEIWKPLWALLPQYRHIAIDLPGHGHSPAMPSTASLADLAAAVADIASAHGARSLVAVSFGGILALETARLRPGNFDRLILNSPALGGGEQDSGVQACNLRLIRAHRAGADAAALSHIWLSDDHDVFRGLKAQENLWADATAVIRQYRWQGMFDGTVQKLTETRQDAHYLRSITTPTLVVIGEDDMPAFKRNAEMLCRYLPDGRKVYAAARGHLAFLEDPQEASVLIEAAIDRP